MAARSVVSHLTFTRLATLTYVDLDEFSASAIILSASTTVSPQQIVYFNCFAGFFLTANYNLILNQESRALMRSVTLLNKFIHSWCS
jgi:hypothetical protein